MFIFATGSPLGEIGRRVLAAAGPLDVPGVDVGTLVPASLLTPDWVHHEWTSDGTTVAADVDDLVLVNGGLNASGLGRLYSRFVAPAGCTEVTLRIRMRSVSGTPQVYTCIYQPGVGPVTGSAGAYLAPTLSTTVTEYTTVVPVTAGQEYGALLFFNAAGQVSALIESVRVEPDAGADGIFGGTFYRVPLDHLGAALDAFPARWHDGSTSKSNLSQVSPGSRWDILTDATAFALEGGPVAGTYSQASVEVDGDVSTSATFAAYELKTFSLAPGERRVGIVSAPHTTAGALRTGSSVSGCWPRALYVGSCTTLELSALPLPERRVLVYGDSITVGYNATLGESHWALLRRDGVCAPLLYGAGSASLHADGADASARQALVDSLAGLDFDDLWLAIGTNDWGLAPTTVATFQAAYSDLLDKLVAAYPSAHIYAQTPLPRSGTTNSNGETIAQYRTAIDYAAAGRATVMRVDGTSLCAIGDLPDGTHPTDSGAAVLAASIEAVLAGTFDGGTIDDVILVRQPALYLDFGDVSTLYQDLGSTLVTTNGQSIRQVNDKSGNARHWTAPSSGQSPAYTTAQQNGRSAAVFNGVTNSRYLAGSLGASGSGMHVFVVYRLDADPPSSLNDVGMWHLSSYNAMAGHHPFTDGNIYDTTGANQRLTVGNPTPSLTTARIYEVQSSASGWTARLDGSQLYTTASNVFAWATTGELGRNSGGTQYMRGAVMALVVFPAALSTADATAVRNALKSIWGTA